MLLWRVYVFASERLMQLFSSAILQFRVALGPCESAQSCLINHVLRWPEHASLPEY